MVRKFNKLVRDRIPEIIMSTGSECKIRTLNDEEYLKMIDEKLDEELADLLEVIRAAAIARGYTLDELEAVRAAKAEKRGGFEKRILLIETNEM